MPITSPESQTRAAAAALIRDYYAAFNTGNSDAMLSFLTDDVIHDVNQGERRHGKDKFKAFNARMDHNYSEELKDIVVLVSKDGTRAAAEFNVHGVYKNSEDGLPPAKGQKYVLPAGTFFALRDGKISRVTT
ncbi:MAG: nuclear transport factor 2 family protein, partial [Hyphomicrobium sp.]|nr:nuclear transport factor 2 family protein [Hyphomicrobium sp.]